MPEGHRQGNTPSSTTITSRDLSLSRVPSLGLENVSGPATGCPTLTRRHSRSLRDQNIEDRPYNDARGEQMLERQPRSGLTCKATALGGIFITRVVEQRYVPSDGLCYVFDDGSTCPTVIDGRLVNPIWGTTKVGKARKRVAQACLYERSK